MAILQAPRFTWYSLGSSSTRSCTRINITATINLPRNQVSPDDLSIPKIIASRGLVEEFETRTGYTSLPTTGLEKNYDHDSIINLENSKRRSPNNPPDAMVIAKLYAIMESVADRVEMHKNIGAQRDNWNLLLLTSINAITLTAATLAGLAATINASGPPLVALKISSTILYVAATGMLVVMNKIQPSQLAEEQRNSARLFKQLHLEIQTTLAVRDPTATGVSDAMEKVLALDRAYPLPLLGAMLEKFPKAVEPTVWWPPKRQRQLGKQVGEETDGNGWDGKLEGEMREIAGILKRKDVAEYLKLSKKALKVSGILAISGPLLTAVGALGSAFVGTIHGTPAVIFAVIGGALASVVNTMEHGGQVGMVFEMYRSTAGLFRLMQETIESNISERDVEGRENGEILKLKVALQLGRSLTELENLAAASSRNSKQAVEQEFASKLF
ncbi:probable F-box protein At4g22030 [Juglans microcarpa x Juglans regia]|uniref:probable F-box protein At4g22030 n=1 Tax=Juglans microcarpa x Juglans regia TaxID=2249226 RepID=UPI001B7EFFDE|nr:probable F-box protein At4g22030 [Juglans microcarpa x Juglans regia]